MTTYKKTDTKHSLKKSEEDYCKLIKDQGRALYLLNKRIKDKSSEIRKLKQEIGHLRNVNKVRTIEKFNDKEMYDFKNIVISALRYALGRRTYITVETANFIKNNPEVVDERTKDVMLRDLKEYFENRGNYFVDDKCDYDTWVDLKEWLERCNYD